MACRWKEVHPVKALILVPRHSRKAISQPPQLACVEACTRAIAQSVMYGDVSDAVVV